MAAPVMLAVLATALVSCSTHVEISVDAPGGPGPFPSPTFRVPRDLVVPHFNDPPMPYATPTPYEPAHPPSVAGWPVGPDGTVVRIVLNDGPVDEGTYSFTVDGDVVRAADTSVSMSRADLTSWHLSRAQLATVLGALDAAGVRTAEPGSFGEEAGAASAAVFFEPGSVISGTDPRLVETARAVTRPPRAGVRPWTPYAIGFLAGPPDRTGRSPLTDADPFRPWPLARGILALTQDVLPNAYGEPERAFCLQGAAAGRVWRRLFTGENTAYLRVDDGRRWELTASVVLPGYVQHDSPCDGVTVSP